MVKWINAIYKIRATLDSEKTNASFSSAIGNIFTGSFLSALLFIILESSFHVIEDFLITFFSIYPGKEGSEFFLTLIIYPLVLIVVFVSLSLLAQIIYFLFAKLLGGIGSFREQFYLASLVMPQIIIGLNIILWLQIFSIHVDFLIIFASIVSLILFIYTIYSFYVVFKVAHNFSAVKYIVVIMVPNILFFVIRLFFV